MFWRNDHAYRFDFDRAASSLGCATNSAAPGPEPDINIYQLSRVAAGTEHDTGPVSAQFAVEVKNNDDASR